MMTHELLDALDHRVSYRQIDYWLRTGRIWTSDKPRPGSGNRRQFSAAEVEAIRAFIDIHERHAAQEEEMRQGITFGKLVAQAAAVIVAVAVGICVLTLRTDASSQPVEISTGSGAVVAAVRLGDRGDTVRQIQARLRSYGYTVAIDGQFGRQTQRVIRAWQKSNALPATGIGDPRTLATLGISHSPPSPGPRPIPVIPSPGAPASGAGDTESIIRAAWPDDLEERALAIAYRESRLIPTARNSCCYGLFQIHWGAHRGWLASIGVTDPAQLLDAQTNAEAALALYQRNGWAPWNV